MVQQINMFVDLELLEELYEFLCRTNRLTISLLADSHSLVKEYPSNRRLVGD
jgi:hypothetical protein